MVLLVEGMAFELALKGVLHQNLWVRERIKMLLAALFGLHELQLLVSPRDMHPTEGL